MIRKLSIVVLIAALLVGRAQASPRHPAKGQTEILWDTWGVPHIFAESSEAAFHAFGWAQAASHGNLVLRLYGQARGRGAEYWGADFLAEDEWVRTNGVPERARQWYSQQDAAFRRNLDAFAAGINDYAAAHGDRLDPAVKVVLPVTAVDVLAHAERVVDFSFIAGAARAEAQRFEGGSNAWAIGPKRSASGNAMLLVNPHLPWRDFYRFYEAEIVAPGINVYGATMVGVPVLVIGFNDHLGWTHTVNTIDAHDEYELTLAEGGYRWNGNVRPFDTSEETIEVKQKDGTLRAETLRVRRAAQGPVIGEKDGRAIALRVAGLDQPGMLQEWWDLARATNLTEFEMVLRRLQIPMFTVMYADRNGHILHVFNGRVPLRPKGSWDWSELVPGDTSNTLWDQTHPYDDLPRVLDPPSGWLQNANDPPWTTTFPSVLDPRQFPSYMAPRFMNLRAQRAVRMIQAHTRMSYEDLIKAEFSTRMELADRMLDDLIAAARQYGGEKAKRAADVLATWDRSADAQSRGAVLFEAFVAEWRRRRGPRGIFATPWNESDPLATPAGLPDPEGAAAALASAATKVETAFGRMDVPWGDVYHFASDGVNLPANGGPSDLGIFSVIDYDSRRRAQGGDSFMAAIEFSKPVRAMVLLGYGNASQPGSSHTADQFPLLARKQMRPVWRTRRQLEGHLEMREAFQSMDGFQNTRGNHVLVIIDCRPALPTDDSHNAAKCHSTAVGSHASGERAAQLPDPAYALGDEIPIRYCKGMCDSSPTRTQLHIISGVKNGN